MLLTSIQTSTDHSQQCSAPFKAGNSRQARTCYISQNTTQRKRNILTGSISIGETGVLMTLNHRASEKQCLPLKHADIFALTWFKLRHSIAAVIQCCYHNLHIYHNVFEQTCKLNTQVMELFSIPRGDCIIWSVCKSGVYK